MRTAVFFVASSLLVACSTATSPGSEHEASAERQGGAKAAGELTELSEEAASDLAFMREEEKLARDVYVAMYRAWGVPVHRNIARSEQKHTDALDVLLDRFGVEDPVVDDTLGVFTDPTLDALYGELVALGTTSHVDGLLVGATIEDLDIVDIAHAMDRTDDPVLLGTYASLLCGSRNHLRSFFDLLADEGVDYEPQFMTPEELEDIVTTSYEICAGA